MPIARECDRDKDRPHVLLVLKGLGIGGAERLAAGSLRLADHGSFRYSVFNLAPRCDDLGDAVRGTGAFVTGSPFLGPRAPWAFLRLARYVTRERVSIIHAHLPVAGVVARLVGALCKVPVLYTEHSEVSRHRPAVRAVNRLTYALNGRVIAVSQSVKDSIERCFGVRSGGLVQVVANGVDADELVAEASGSEALRAEWGLSRDHHVYGTVGNLRAEKSHDVLIRAFAAVRQSVPKARLVIVGEGPLRRDLEALSSATTPSGTVLFPGTNRRAGACFAAFDTFVISSRSEGLPLSLLEAMTLGRPVVSTFVGGIPEVVTDGAEGLLVPPGDAARLARAMVRTATEPSLRARLSSGARVRARNFANLATAVKTMEQIYLELSRPRQRTSEAQMAGDPRNG